MAETHYLYKKKIKLIVNHEGRQHRYLVSKKLPDGTYSEPIVTQGITSNLEVIPKDLKGWAAWMASDYWYREIQLAQAERRFTLPNEQELKNFRDEAANAYKVASHKGKTGGTDFHTALETYFKTGALPLGELTVEVAEKCVQVIEWWEQSGWEAIEAEKPVYSRDHDYATKIDLYAKRPDGIFVAVNWKSNKPSRIAPDGIYWEHFVQGGGEALALIEQGEPCDDICIINPSSVNEEGDLIPVFASTAYEMSVDDCIHVFSLCRALTHDIDFFNRRRA